MPLCKERLLQGNLLPSWIKLMRNFYDLIMFDCILVNPGGVRDGKVGILENIFLGFIKNEKIKLIVFANTLHICL